MKFDTKTIDILKNFNMINPSVLFKPGKIISTISPLKTILVMAEIEDEIPREFAIYELSKFLGALSIIPDADINFGEHQMIINNNMSKIKYTYASPNMIQVSPYKEIPMSGNLLAKFDLPYSVLTNIIKAASILQLPDIVISCNDGDVTIKADNNDDTSSNEYTVKVGESENNFKLVFNVENLKLLNRDYTVEVPNKGFVKFSSSNISYWIAATIT